MKYLPILCYLMIKEMLNWMMITKMRISLTHLLIQSYNKLIMIKIISPKIVINKMKKMLMKFYKILLNKIL
jgi:hypothetical protein